MAAGDESMLTVAPPVKLTPDMFTDTELSKYGLSGEQIRLLRLEGELLLQ
jgi:hypothetical protein